MIILHAVVHTKSMCPMVTMLILATLCGNLTCGTSLLVLLEVSEFRTLFVDPDATLEADLVLKGEKLGSGAFTFCFNSAGRECRSSGSCIKAGTAGIGSLGVMSFCTGSEAGYLGFRCSFVLQRADLS